MATTMATMAVANAKCMTSINSPKNMNSTKSNSKPISLPSMHKVQKTLLAYSKPYDTSNLLTPLTSSAIAGAIFSTLSTCEPALATQQIAQLAEGSDNRGLALLLPIIPAIGWVLFNILQPALNQINRMRNSKGIIVGLGLGGLAALGVESTPHASAAASELAMIADASSAGDNRGTLLLIVVTPAILWVLYNILQPALNQINKMSWILLNCFKLPLPVTC